MVSCSHVAHIKGSQQAISNISGQSVVTTLGKCQCTFLLCAQTPLPEVQAYSLVQFRTADQDKDGMIGMDGELPGFH